MRMEKIVILKKEKKKDVYVPALLKKTIWYELEFVEL